MTRLYRSFHPQLAALAIAAALAVTGATLAATGAPAHAAGLVVTGNPAPTARIAYDDLDLRSPAGLARLQARIHAAADKLCVGAGVETLKDRLDGLACRDEAIASAAPQVRRAAGAVASAASNAPIVLALGR
ncbi:MAG TPA: UrcA family protein [Allosphingosinicella sp.]|jgi:UrcA family protein